MNIEDFIKQKEPEFKKLCDILENERDEIVCVNFIDYTVKYDFEFNVNINYKDGSFKSICFEENYKEEIINEIEKYFKDYSNEEENKVYLNIKNIDKINYIKKEDNEYIFNICDDYDLYFESDNKNFIESIFKNKIKIKTDLKNEYYIYCKDINCLNFQDFLYNDDLDYTYCSICYKDSSLLYLNKEEYIENKKRIELINNINNF